MKTCYVIKEVWAIADLVSPGELMPHWTITRINVPVDHRGHGYGRQLLQMIIDDADQESITLALEPSPSDGLDYDQLVNWYARHDFVMGSLGYMIRKK